LTIRVLDPRLERITQGDILRDVDYIESVIEDEGAINVTKIVFPLMVVLTQDCDLEQNHNARLKKYAKGTGDSPTTHDKFIFTVLVSPLFNETHFFTGTHLDDISINMQMQLQNRELKNVIKLNKNPRYHYVEFPTSVNAVNSVIDFKHYYTINFAYLNKIRSDKLICTVGELYREDISHRFASFLSRIGLPDAENGLPLNNPPLP